jgi:hypothetical protein
MCVYHDKRKQRAERMTSITEGIFVHGGYCFAWQYSSGGEQALEGLQNCYKELELMTEECII